MKTETKYVTLSPEQAFAAMFVFLDEYYKRTNGKAVLADVLGDTQLMPGEGTPADPAAWQDWLAAIRVVLSDAQAKAVSGGR